MTKKPAALDGLLNTESRPTDTGKPQREAVQGAAQDMKTTKRPGEKRLTLALDGEAYKRLRLHAADLPDAPGHFGNCPCGIP